MPVIEIKFQLIASDSKVERTVLLFSHFNNLMMQ
jgi:hypothetical protein